MDQSRKDGHFLVTFGHLLCYDLSVICRELILSISGSPQRKKLLDNGTKSIYSCQWSKAK